MKLFSNSSIERLISSFSRLSSSSMSERVRVRFSLPVLVISSGMLLVFVPSGPSSVDVPLSSVGRFNASESWNWFLLGSSCWRHLKVSRESCTLALFSSPISFSRLFRSSWCSSFNFNFSISWLMWAFLKILFNFSFNWSLPDFSLFPHESLSLKMSSRARSWCSIENFGDSSPSETTSCSSLLVNRLSISAIVWLIASFMPLLHIWSSFKVCFVSPSGMQFFNFSLIFWRNSFASSIVLLWTRPLSLPSFLYNRRSILSFSSIGPFPPSFSCNGLFCPTCSDFSFSIAGLRSSSSALLSTKSLSRMFSLFVTNAFSAASWISSNFNLSVSFSFCKSSFSFSSRFLSSFFSLVNSFSFLEISCSCNVSASFKFVSYVRRFLSIAFSRFWLWLFSLCNFSSILLFSLTNSSISPARSPSFCLETSSSSRCFSAIDLSSSSSPSYSSRMSSSFCWISISFLITISSYRCSRSFLSNSKLFSKFNCSFLNSASRLSFSCWNSFFSFSISLRCLSSNSFTGCCPRLITSIFCLCCPSISINAFSCSCFSLAISSMRATSTSSLVTRSGFVSKEISRL